MLSFKTEIIQNFYSGYFNWSNTICAVVGWTGNEVSSFQMMHCMYSSMVKSNSRAEATFNMQ